MLRIIQRLPEDNVDESSESDANQLTLCQNDRNGHAVFYLELDSDTLPDDGIMRFRVVDKTDLQVLIANLKDMEDYYD